jgi:hypothetical protein
LLEPAEPVTRTIFAVGRRGGDSRPAVRVVLDILAEQQQAVDAPAEANAES